MRVFKFILIAGVMCGMASCASFKEMVGDRFSSVTSSISRKGDQNKDTTKESGSSRAMQRFFNKKNKKSGDQKKRDAEARQIAAVAAVSADEPQVAATDSLSQAKATDTVRSEADLARKAEYNAISEHLNGEWMFDNAYGKVVPGEDDRPSIYFDAVKKRFYSYNGCNYINGDYVIDGSDRLRFDDLVSTQEYCADKPESAELSALIKQTRYFKLTTLRKEEYIELMNEQHRKIGTLHRHCLESLNGMWEVAEIRGQKIGRDVAPTIVIDLPEKRVHGHSGCNLFTGSIYQDPDKELSVQFQGMRVPKSKCSNIGIQTSLLVALEQVEQAHLDGDLRAVLCDEEGNPLVVLVRTE
ncbi:MAG: META domain-containing protein [Bacteroidales bacterium]|nr:META domain-containing protein [Bacteroidales bacterium]